MKNFSFGLLIKITILAIFLFVFSSIVSRDKIFVSTYNNATGGGGSFTTVDAGFPIDFFSNPNSNAEHSIIWYKLLLNSIFWLIVSALIFITYKRLKK